ncbi:MAG: histidine phosphatase family protein [Aquabacterium sp.]|jgi:alpha-ribazole phosphatase|uniref:histidine phosphatase family protein n=1 Tax=Aquabacterium sp. TaxID=1872578 RepID=UPI001B6FB731|nr:histidine phosphatase family protein [Aquabacterium sp.]MBP7131689.1 histidine phosphatase family protein [Aquabacterium sp.]
MNPSTLPLIAWRHPRPMGAQGRCIGRTDLAVDRRKTKRLAHRIRQAARRHGWPRTVYSSPLQRCAAVGRQLRRWGWQHHIDASLLEMDFGTWDGLTWPQITHTEVDAWCRNFAHHAPGGGENLHAMLERVAQCLTRLTASAPDSPVLIVAHAGWILSARWVTHHASAPVQPDQWPPAPLYGECCVVPVESIQYRPVEPANRK